MMLPGRCAQVFCVLSHHRELHSVCVNCQADVRDQEEDKWQCCFRVRLGMKCTHGFTFTYVYLSCLELKWLAILQSGCIDDAVRRVKA